MTKPSTHVATPFYILKSDKQPIFPTITFDEKNSGCICVYGFSDKPIYDKFIQSTDKLLTPYPLVGGYLENRIAEAAAPDKEISLCLVILDATNRSQQTIVAATMATVIEAQQDKDSQTPIEFELTLDSATGNYSI